MARSLKGANDPCHVACLLSVDGPGAPGSPAAALGVAAVAALTWPRTIAVLADCHIHPGGGIAWPAAALARLKGVDLIITLGDMGESVGLDALETIAPVVGVKGQDDQDDPRCVPAARLVQAGGLRIGCVFDPVEHGLAAGKAPFVPAKGAAEAEERLFGGPVDVLLTASTHVPAVQDHAGRLIVDPGSVTLPTGRETGAPGTFARLTLAGGKALAEIVEV
jgi:putative phosphoesterase